MVVNPYIIRFRIHIGGTRNLRFLTVSKTAISIKMHDFNS
jgi:hypothetical protein